MFWSRLSSLAVLGGLALSAHPAAAQQMGHDGYAFPARTPSMAAQFDFQQKMQNGTASSGTGSLGALNELVTQYNSSSTSIANMNQVNQTVSGNSTATVGQSTDQASTGSQDATASTKTKVDDSITHNQTTTGIQP